MSSTNSNDFSSIYRKRFNRIPRHLQINVLYDDNEIVVIDKPCNLRSVPGHANPPPLPSQQQMQKRASGTEVTPRKNNKKRSYNHPNTSQNPDYFADKRTANSTSSIHDSRRRTGQEAWVLAIRTFQDIDINAYSSSSTVDNKSDPIDNDGNNDNDPYASIIANNALRRLAEATNLIDSVPRKFKLFRRYIERNKKKLVEFSSFASESRRDDINHKLMKGKKQNNADRIGEDGKEVIRSEISTSTTKSNIDIDCRESFVANNKNDIERTDIVGNNPKRNKSKHCNKNNEPNNEALLDKISTIMFQRIQERQQPLLNLPEPTKDEDSAFGQLLLLMRDASTTIVENTTGNKVMMYKQDKKSDSGDRINTINSTTENPDVQKYAESKSLSLSPSPSVKNQLFVVHRLDCETSGVMVFAKTEHAASNLSKVWRERDQRVSKIYLAMVRYWPPYHQQQLVKGEIHLLMEPHPTERLKWRVVEAVRQEQRSNSIDTSTSGDKNSDNSNSNSNSNGNKDCDIKNSINILKTNEENDETNAATEGKPSTTLWKVVLEKNVVIGVPTILTTTSRGRAEPAKLSLPVDTVNKYGDAASTAIKPAVVLELQPRTGRTHQLRIHCEHIGSGIIGDSLYGEDYHQQKQKQQRTLRSELIVLPGNSRSSTDVTSTPKDNIIAVGQTLCLHAYKLSFPHPTTHVICTYSSSPSWL